jgi:DNA-binding transcriptional LysR family regulator
VRIGQRRESATGLLGEWTPPLARLCLYYPNRRNPSAAFRALIEMARDLERSD